jgi:hypothetical protein
MLDAKTPKPIALGKLKPLLAGTSLARICAAGQIHRRGDRQGGRPARGSGGAPPAARAGGGAWDRHNRADDGVITLVLPEGVPAEALIAGEAKAGG